MRAIRTTCITLAAAAAVVALTVTGCGKTGTPTPAAALTAPPTTAAPTTPAPPAMTAEKVLAKLTAAGLGVTNGAVQDENTDPNNLIGRPGQYVSRASFDLPDGNTAGDKYSVDRGGAIEVFTDAAGAQARSKYIQDKLSALGPIAGTEYHYLSGPVLVRITGKIKPSAAAKFETAVKAL